MSPLAETLYIVMRILLWVSTVLAFVFPYLYHRRTQGTWSFTPIGRHVMQFRLLFAVLLLATAVSVYLPVVPILVVAIVLYIGVLAVLIQQIVFVIVPNKMDPEDLLDDPAGDPQARKAALLIREETPVKSRPVVIVMSILGALQFLFGGLAALNLPDASYNATVLTVGAFGTLFVAAAQFGMQFYVQNLVTPHEDVASYRDKTGTLVSGPAAPPEGEPVDVVHEDDRGRL